MSARISLYRLQVVVLPGESSYLYHDRTHRLLRIWQAVTFTKSYNIHKQVVNSAQSFTK